ncbi:alpha/beta hydrolase [Marinifilum caeruleilacunae]|uniref:Alpha/beta hydrolase n=1 Tax=Marinifilum caeruleilacunae TaxID=2499076 RepID=A0ABX1WUD8_9BACT|nr:alpha/beta fold hydrolase [Marinifilum caeruleilacunae]NOU59646.1 alpha/beta hydrolase [Marinifilum caeruleilacunae]
MKRRIALLALLTLALNLFAQLEHEIVLETETGNIKGTLLIPSTAEKTAVVLIIAGSGPTDRNGNNPMMTNNSLKMLAEGLQKNGIASLRYDKRGIGESTNSGLQEIDLRFEHYVKDVEDWIDLLNKDERFSEIIVLGHSEGSLIGMIASQKSEVEKFISLAGVGIPAGDIIREQLKAQPPVVLDHSLPIIEKLESGETVEDVPLMLYSLFRPSVQPYMISWFRYNPQKEIAKLDKPILIIQGTTDIQVSVSNADQLAMANEKSQKLIIEGMNHVLKESEADRQKNIQTYAMPDLPLKKELIGSIVGFIE